MPAAPKGNSPNRHDGLLARLGQNVTNSPRQFWLLGHGRSDFEHAHDLIERLMEKHPRVNFLLTSTDPTTRAWLQERFPAPRGIVLPPPLPIGLVSDRYLDNLNVRGMAVLGRVAPADQALMRAGNRRALPVLVVENPATDGKPATAEDLGAVKARVDHHFVTSAQSAMQLLEAGIDGDCISEMPTDSAARSAHFETVVSQLLVQDLKLLRSKLRPIRRRLERLALHCMNSPKLRSWLDRKARRFDTVEDLRTALGNPDTILCLGNGPTSEGPEVAAAEHDCLFRVNFLWLKRGFLTEPDMVFTGSKEALKLVRGAVFGLQSIRSEARLLVTRMLNPIYPRMQYMTIERFGLFLSESHLRGVRPTNGAAMLAVAVALQPARLVISGIDLFSHPDGTYPGDSVTPNAYTPGHNPDSELALLLEALDRYQGELTILSPALREEWRAHRAGRGLRESAV